VTDICKPHGRRTTASFGPRGEQAEGKIHPAFGEWLDLFKQHPAKVLSFKRPCEAIARTVNPVPILTVGDLIDK